MDQVEMAQILATDHSYKPLVDYDKEAVPQKMVPLCVDVFWMIFY